MYLGRLGGHNHAPTLSLEASCITPDGDPRWVRIDGANLVTDAAVRGLVLSLADVTELRREVTQLALGSTIDPLTGLENRRAL